MELVTDDRCPPPMALLRTGVPLSLLLDLAFGPDSAHVLATEGPGRPVIGRGAVAVPSPRAATAGAVPSRTPPAALR